MHSWAKRGVWEKKKQGTKKDEYTFKIGLRRRFVDTAVVAYLNKL